MSISIWIVVGLAVFLFGILVGYQFSIKNKNLDKRLKAFVVIVVVIVWSLTIIVEIVVPTYTVSTLIHGIMGAVAGYLLGDEGITLNLGQK